MKEYLCGRKMVNDMSGDFMMTFTGKEFYPANPTPPMIDIEDIAHALSMMPRFGGHTIFPYSVARHSILCAKMAPKQYKLEALLHDATEAYIADIVTPAKILMSQYYDLEYRIHCAIAARFDIPTDMSPDVKVVDRRMLITEARQLLRDFSWTYDSHWPEPYKGVDICESTWNEDKEEFLYLFHMLR